jgi:tetratricopeptide (TPR) repeat protein
MKWYLILFVLLGGKLLSQNRVIDSLKKDLEERSHQIPTSFKNDSLAGMDAIFLAERLRRLNTKEAVAYSERSLRIFLKIRCMPRMATSLMTMAGCYRRTNQFDDALKCCEFSLDIGKILGDSAIISSAYVNYGNIEMSLSKYNEALKYQVMGLEIKQKTGADLVDSYNNMANIYFHMKDYTKAIEFFEKALKLREANGKIGVMNADFYSNLAAVYNLNRRFREAYAYHYKLLNFARQTGALDQVGSQYHNLGGHFDMQGNVDSSIYYQKKALEIHEKLGNVTMIAVSLSNLGNTVYKLKKYQEAQEYYKKAAALLPQINSMDMNMVSHENLSRTSYMLGNYKEAYDLLDDFKKEKDSLDKINNSKEFGKLEAKMEFDKKNLVNEINHKKEIEKQKALAAVENKQKNIIMIFISLILLVVVFFSYIVLKRYKITRRQNAIIEHQKDEVEKKNEIIETKQKEILDSFHYADRIQRSLLPSEKFIEKHLGKK